MSTPAARSTGQVALVGVLGICLLDVCLFVGCSSVSLPWHKVPLDAATGFYQAASLTYRLDAGKLEQPLDVARIDGQRVSYEQVASSPLSDQSIGTLSITYPHPAGRAGYALVKFALESNPTKPKQSKSWIPFRKSAKDSWPPMTLASSQPEVHERWQLDIPNSESDQFFKAVSSQGFYQMQKPDAVGAQLTVRINGREVRKNWDQIAELNGLIQRVRREGQLVSYVRPGAMNGGRYNPISSTRAYSQLLAETGSGNAVSAAANSSVNAFSMAPQSADGATNVANLPAVTR
ncbi:MAG: hypothetical protein HY288_07765 [Planctomycetia bacterium]|nr:hypothetical protein [Planctomycetia bacterium]